MLREEMELLLDFYFRGAEACWAKDSLDLKATSREIEDFLWAAARHVEIGVRNGEFDVQSD